MKKTITTLLALLVCSILPLHAYEYFTIYFSDGTKSNAFYATDVDSICYSKIGLDSIEYADWQVQEIYTCDSIYRYSLAQIDSLSFKDVDIDVVAENIDRACGTIVPLYAQYNSMENLSQHLSSICNVEGVENAWIDNQTLFVKIRDYGTITFLYSPTPSSDDEVFLLSQSRRINTRRFVQVTDHTLVEVHNACVFYQLEKNEDSKRKTAKSFSVLLNDSFNSFGISSQRITNVGPEFFVNNIFDYDLIFLITHGWYDKETDTHWLFTGEEIGYSLNSNNIPKIIKHLKENRVYSPNKLCYSCVLEYRNGKWYAIFYSCVSDKLIASSRNSFKSSNTLLFNTACESLKQNNNLANVFINKGACCYLGYTDANRWGHAGGYSFFSALLNGSCIGHAYESLYDSLKEEVVSENGNTYHPVLRLVKTDDDVLKRCITHTETMPIEELYANEAISIKLKGRIKKHNSFFLAHNYTYGFQISTNPDMSQAVDSTVVGIYDSSALYMNWADTLDVRTLQPNTTYYYRAFMNDGYSDCYGEVKSFTTENIEAYAVLNDGTLTFYYDGKQNERIGRVFKISFFYNKNHNFESWYDDVYIVDFDLSFYYYTPWRTYCWFNLFHNLTEVRNINRLNTSKTTEMGFMFANCSSLKSLDLRSFDTSNVTSMYGMFSSCSSLTNLDINSFDTHNVIKMGHMFATCSSLTSIDVSSFDTSNVTEMSYMFGFCSSLKSIDLSHFKVSKDTHIDYMFQRCSSLTTIYAGNWNAGVWSNYMFYECDNLAGGKGSKIGYNYYYDENGEQHWYYCWSSGASAHIDGGKDNPGLFTGK